MILNKVVGTRHNVSIEVAAWDGVGAAVDLSCACMFTHEIGNEPPKGGLAHLDDALGGRLLELRKEGYFRASAGETLLVDGPPATV